MSFLKLNIYKKKFFSFALPIRCQPLFTKVKFVAVIFIAVLQFLLTVLFPDELRLLK